MAEINIYLEQENILKQIRTTEETTDRVMLTALVFMTVASSLIVALTHKTGAPNLSETTPRFRDRYEILVPDEPLNQLPTDVISVSVKSETLQK